MAWSSETIKIKFPGGEHAANPGSPINTEILAAASKAGLQSFDVLRNGNRVSASEMDGMLTNQLPATDNFQVVPVDKVA